MIQALLQPGQTAIDSTKTALKAEVDTILENVRREASTILADAQKKVATIHSAARDTASGVSLITARDQFETLMKQFRRGAIAAGVAAAIGFIGFFGYALYLLNHPPEIANYPTAIFSLGIRVTILGSLAAIVGIALRIFKSNLHLFYHTLHRQQLTNSIPTFVEAARTDEQRDAIFARLVDAVSSFGNSGLVDTKDEFPNSAKVIIDALPKLAKGTAKD